MNAGATTDLAAVTLAAIQVLEVGGREREVREQKRAPVESTQGRKRGLEADLRGRDALELFTVLPLRLFHFVGNSSLSVGEEDEVTEPEDS